MRMKLMLVVMRDSAQEDYLAKKAEVAELARCGWKRQAYESMKTAKHHLHDYDTWHAMQERVERIKNSIKAQHQNVAVFSAFSEANTALADMLAEAPLERVEAVLDEMNERMTHTEEVSGALGQTQGDTVDDDELSLFLAESRTTAAEPVLLSPVSSKPAQAVRLAME